MLELPKLWLLVVTWSRVRVPVESRYRHGWCLLQTWLWRKWSCWKDAADTSSPSDRLPGFLAIAALSLCLQHSLPLAWTTPHPKTHLTASPVSSCLGSSHSHRLPCLRWRGSLHLWLPAVLCPLWTRWRLAFTVSFPACPQLRAGTMPVHFCLWPPKWSRDRGYFTLNNLRPPLFQMWRPMWHVSDIYSGPWPECRCIQCQWWVSPHGRLPLGSHSDMLQPGSPRTQRPHLDAPTDVRAAKGHVAVEDKQMAKWSQGLKLL